MFHGGMEGDGKNEYLEGHGPSLGMCKGEDMLLAGIFYQAVAVPVFVLSKDKSKYTGIRKDSSQHVVAPVHGALLPISKFAAPLLSYTILYCTLL